MSKQSSRPDSQLSMSFAAGSRAKTTRAPTSGELASMVLKAVFGPSLGESSPGCAAWGPAQAGSWSKTWRAVRTSGLTDAKQTWKGLAMRRYRSRFRQAMSVHGIDGLESSSLLGGYMPAMTTALNMLSPCMARWKGHRNLAELLSRLGIHGQPSAGFWELYQGFPLRWTARAGPSSVRQKALGNAVVPQCAELVGRMMRVLDE